MTFIVLTETGCAAGKQTISGLEALSIWRIFNVLCNRQNFLLDQLVRSGRERADELRVLRWRGRRCLHSVTFAQSGHPPWCSSAACMVKRATACNAVTGSQTVKA